MTRKKLKKTVPQSLACINIYGVSHEKLEDQNTLIGTFFTYSLLKILGYTAHNINTGES